MKINFVLLSGIWYHTKAFQLYFYVTIYGNRNSNTIPSLMHITVSFSTYLCKSKMKKILYFYVNSDGKVPFRMENLNLKENETSGK